MEIKAIVESLCKKYDTRDPYEIAKQKGIIVHSEPLGEIRGYFNKCYRQKFIHINSDLPDNEQYMTCGHELGHALDFIPLWLAKISITPTMQAENPEVADKLVQYQLKAKDVLAAAFLPTNAQRPMSQAEIILQQAQFMVDFERRQKEQERALDHVSKRLDAACDAIELSPNAWREGCRKLIVRIAQKMGGNEFIRDVQAEVFKLVDERAGASLETRLTNKRRRMADEGVCKSKRDKLNKIDVIADDKKLIEVYMHIVKQMAIKYGVDNGEREDMK